jgi:pantoate--beta-alanine ligase
VQIVRGNADLANARAALSDEGGVALVPTMGALHAGHMALVAEASRLAQSVVASIFVNPAQFGPAEDLASYPRSEANDLAMLEEAGCDLVWLPQVADIYPDGFATTVSVGGVSQRWEGASRPGHFDGVATVVAKLLNAVAPDLALFGEKDFQQLAVIRRMTADLGIPVKIVGVPTVREPDGLALSSRNAYLSPDERQRAAALFRSLADAAGAIRQGIPIERALAAVHGTLAAGGFATDYVALVDAQTLEPMTRPDGEMRLIAAAKIGGTRLIDNLPVRTKSSQR